MRLRGLPHACEQLLLRHRCEPPLILVVLVPLEARGNEGGSDDEPLDPAIHLGPVLH